jgi:hypothetical protein
MHCVVETPFYLRAAKEAGVTEEEQQRIKVFLSENPDAGDVIPGTGGSKEGALPRTGARKERWCQIGHLLLGGGCAGVSPRHVCQE